MPSAILVDLSFPLPHQSAAKARIITNDIALSSRVRRCWTPAIISCGILNGRGPGPLIPPITSSVVLLNEPYSICRLRLLLLQKRLASLRQRTLAQVLFFKIDIPVPLM